MYDKIDGFLHKTAQTPFIFNLELFPEESRTAFYQSHMMTVSLSPEIFLW